MKKILLAIDGLQISMNALDFACYIARLTRSKITGVFLENLVGDQRHALKEKQIIPSLSFEIDTDFAEIENKTREIEKNIDFFKQACIRREATFDIHRDRGTPAKEMIEESRFADLLIIDAETTFNKRFEGTPTEFVKETLVHAECPVIVSPKSFESIDEIIFTYDATRSSVFAIKQFCYLLPELRDKKATLLGVVPGDENTIRQKHQVNEWMKIHYANCECKVMHGEIKDQLFSYLLSRRNAFVVMGSYGRKLVSSLFKKSAADVVVETTDLALFIAHP